MPETDARKQIQAQYDRWSTAYMARDIDTLLSILSPDYTLTSVDNDVLSYGGYKAYLELKRKSPQDNTEYRTHILKLILKKAHAVVTSEETMTTSTPGPSGKKLVSVHKHVYLDTWTYQGRVWHLQSTATQRESTVQLRRQ